MENQEQQIDVNRLLEKYTRSNSAAAASAGAAVAYGTNTSNSKIGICWSCQGQGIEKYMYNHMVMQRTCEKCDGEGVLYSKNATTTTTSSA